MEKLTNRINITILRIHINLMPLTVKLIGAFEKEYL